MVHQKKKKNSLRYGMAQGVPHLSACPGSRAGLPILA